MPACAILQCNNHSKYKNVSNGGVSYHRFPTEPVLKNKWIEATGKVNWFPSKSSTICSEHFHEKYFIIKKSGKSYLTETAIPEKKILHFQQDVPQNRSEPKSEVTLLHGQLKHKLDSGFRTDASSPKLVESCHSSAASPPGTKRLRCTLRWQESKIKKQDLKIKSLRAQNRRLQKKNTKIEDILKTLEEKYSMDNKNITILKNTNVKVNDLVSRQTQNLKSGVISTQRDSPALPSFALILHYYSPKAYEYVRDTFNNCLPHVKTQKKWFAKMGVDPGFTKESFVALKLKTDSTNDPVLATLVIDEMTIRKRIEWDGQKFHGYVDVGTGLEGDHLAEAKEALVFLITALNGNFKIPVAFFLVDGITGVQRAELVKQCIERVHEIGIRIVALTFDGCAANLSMAHNLGCSFQEGNISFEHPITKSPIVAILDPCHMIKLIRNAFQKFETFVDKDGNKVRWQYLVELKNLQEKEKNNLSFKLKHGHINFQNQRIKVKLATQLFSQSVAEAMEFCRKELKITEFKESEATEKFLLLMNHIFDIFNSRNLHQYGFKKALHEKNAAQIFDFLNSACSYISNMILENGTLLTKSSRKTGFLGFLGCAEALKQLYVSLIQEKIIICLPFYKLSQDHLELLLGNIRAHGGSNNNPTARHFVAAYKKLLVHVELKDFGTGNCTALDQLSILNCSSAVERINQTTRPNLTQGDWIEDNTEEYEIGELLMALSEFSSQAISYIAGYIARVLIKKINCDVCVNALISKERNPLHNFIVAKDKGGLVYPSIDMIKICKVAEAILQTYDERIFKKEMVMSKILQQFIGENVFDSISFHQVGQFPGSNHVTDLIKAIAERYVNIRIHHLQKNYVKLSKRQLLNKYVLFQGQ